MKIEVFKYEIELGISELVKANSISYACSISNKTNPTDIELIVKSTASKLKQPDLLYRDAILASTGWNKNDDVFTPEEMIKAKDTPVDKQVNFMHNELDIIGHMTNSFIINGSEDSSYFCPECKSHVCYTEKRIDGDSKCKNGHQFKTSEVIEISKNFDIGVGFVLYKEWENDERKALISNILEQIDTGKWFVSMECRFPKFDYALIDSNGKHSVIKRDNNSSFLSKHLRVYGGSGEFQGHRVGRILRDFHFSGKGIVDNPANERSVIFGEKPVNFISVASLNIRETDMDLEKQVKELEEKLKASEAQVAILAESNKSIAELKDGKEKEVESAKAEYKTLSDRLTEVENTLKVKVESLSKAEDNNSKLMVQLEETEAKVKELSDSIAKAKRVSALTEVGLSVEEAEKTFAKWSTLNDEQFSEIVSLHKKTEAKKEDKKNKEEEKEGETEDSLEVKEEAKANYSKAELDKDISSVSLSGDTKQDISLLAKAMMNMLPHASKAKARQEKQK